MRLRKALVIYLAAKQRRRSDSIEYDGQVGRWFWRRDGNPVHPREIRRAAEAYTSQVQQNMRGYAEALTAGRIDTETYRDLMRAEIRDSVRVNYASGRGGLAQMTHSDWSRTGPMVRTEYAALDRQIAKIQAGELTPGQIHAQSQYMGGQGNVARNNGMRSGQAAAGANQERRISSGDDRVCADCLHYEKLGLQPIGTLPLPGEESACGHNCRCDLIQEGAGPITYEEAAELHSQQMEQLEREGFTGMTYDTIGKEHDTEGYALSIYPERERRIPLAELTDEDFRAYAVDNVDLLSDQSKFPHRLGGWASEDLYVLDVSVVVPPDQTRRAANLVLKYNQDAMWSLHEGRELSQAECRRLLGKSTRAIMAKKKRHLILGSPPYDDAVAMAEFCIDFVDKARAAGGVDPIPKRQRLRFIVNHFRSRELEIGLADAWAEIEEFFKRRPDLRPEDWDPERYMKHYNTWAMKHPDDWPIEFPEADL